VGVPPGALASRAIPPARNCTNEFRNGGGGGGGGGESPQNALNCNEGKISGSAGTAPWNGSGDGGASAVAPAA